MSDQIRNSPSIDLSSLREFVTQKIIPSSNNSSTLPSGSHPGEDLLRQLHQLGWLQSFVPEVLGGSGTNTADLIWISRELAYGSAGLFTSFMSNMIALMTVFLHGPEPLRRQLSQDFLSDFRLYSFCWTEPESGSDVLRIKTKATRIKGGYQLQGSKCFISNSNVAHGYIVVAKIVDENTPSRSPKDSLALFYVPAKTSGLSTGKPLQKMGQSESNTSEVFLDQVFVPDSHLVAGPKDGYRAAVHCLQRTRTLIAAASIGMCHRGYELATTHLRGRALYGKPLLTQPTIRGLLAQIWTEMEAGWLLTSSAAAKWDSGEDAMLQACMAKLFSAEVAVRSIGHFVELFGGYGYTKEYEIERLYRDVKLFQILEGPTFVQQILIAKEILPYTLTDEKFKSSVEEMIRSHKKKERKAA